MTVNTVISGLMRSVRSIENKFMVKLPTELTDFTDLPELVYKKSGGLTKASQKALTIWRDIKKAGLYLKKVLLEEEYERLEKKKVKDEIWDTLKILSERYQSEMGYVRIFHRLIKEAPKKLPKSSLEELDDLRIHLNALLYEAQMWQSHDARYRGTDIDIEIADVLAYIAKILRIKNVEVDAAVMGERDSLEYISDAARLYIGGEEIEL